MSETMNIPLGSQHIALLEPVRFQFGCENEKIVSVKADVGFVHRGVEKACEQKFKFRQVGYVVSRVCGLCAIIHATCYTLAVEKIMQVETTPRAQWLRILANELDRIHSHLLCLAHTAENAGFEALFMQTMRDRELVMESQEAITGNRVQFDFVSIGGVNRDLTSEGAMMVREKMALLEKKVAALHDLFINNWSLSLRFKGIGIVDKAAAQRFNAAGPIARAAGLMTDIRMESDYLPYGDVGFRPIFEESGDIHARNLVRLRELSVSFEMIRNILDGLPEGELSVKVRGNPDGEAFMRVEAPRGECLYYVRGAKKPFLERVRIKTPTFSNVPAMIYAFEGAQYADSAPILASFDPCLSCTAK